MKVSGVMQSKAITEAESDECFVDCVVACCLVLSFLTWMHHKMMLFAEKKDVMKILVMSSNITVT